MRSTDFDGSSYLILSGVSGTPLCLQSAADRVVLQLTACGSSASQRWQGRPSLIAGYELLGGEGNLEFCLFQDGEFDLGVAFSPPETTNCDDAEVRQAWKFVPWD